MGDDLLRPADGAFAAPTAAPPSDLIDSKALGCIRAPLYGLYQHAWLIMLMYGPASALVR